MKKKIAFKFVTFQQRIESGRLFDFYIKKSKMELEEILPKVSHDQKRVAIIEGILEYINRLEEPNHPTQP